MYGVSYDTKLRHYKYGIVYIEMSGMSEDLLKKRQCTGRFCSSFGSTLFSSFSTRNVRCLVDTKMRAKNS